MSLQSSSQEWVNIVRRYYRSGASNQFILFGNINDQFTKKNGETGVLNELLLEVTESFDYVLVYHAAQGILVARGGDKTTAPRASSALPDDCIPEISEIVRRIIYRKIDGSDKSKAKEALKIAVIIHGVDKIASAASAKSTNYPLNHLVAIMRAWSTEDLYRDYPLATFLIAENLADLHPMLSDNHRALQVRVDLPNENDVNERLKKWQNAYPKAFTGCDLTQMARGLKGVKLDTIEQEVRLAHYTDIPFSSASIGTIKKKLLEKEAGDLLEFIPPKKNLNDLEGLVEAKALIRTHLRMWQEGDIKKFPKGYMFNGPVGTGKSFTVECIAGEAGIPVVKLKNFRNMWYGSTEANLERIFRILRALAPCIVFVDEADQSLGKRDSGGNDGGLSGRIYSAIAQEMAAPETRGQVLWILATSRADLVEIDLKRPGRIDVKFALMPTGTPAEAAKLLRALMKRIDLMLTDEDVTALLPVMPDWLTPGAAEAITSDLYTELADAKANQRETTVPAELRRILENYQPPVSLAKMQEQIEIAARECTKVALIPEAFRVFSK
jgi:hypothetical protein